MNGVLLSRSDELADSMLAASWTAAIATGVGALVAGAALWFAYRQIKLAATQMRETSRQEAENSIAQTRPYIGVDFVPGLFGSPAFDIVIQNHGRTLAKNVVLRLDGAEFAAQSEKDQIGPALGRLLATGFDLAPGARRRLLWRIAENERADPPGAQGAPISGEVIATYEWRVDGEETVRQYEYRTSYDLTEYPKLTPSPNTGATANGNDEKAQIRNISLALRAIATHLGEVRR